MEDITIVARNGTEALVRLRPGKSLMEDLRSKGFDDILALCGGCCSCATCHVYIEGEGLGRLDPPSDTENDLLDCSSHRRPGSRLACQVPSDRLSGATRVTIAPEE
ncbi:MAG TPA: ferredoxin [Phenylobacterium sp.]|nr:ferredoxin [Phenylobacterium sp.]